VNLPPGYEGSRSVALKLLGQDRDLFGNAHSYIEPPEARRNLAPAVTAAQAIGDLPPIYAREEVRGGRLRRGARRFDAPVPYGRSSNISAYARLRSPSWCCAVVCTPRASVSVCTAETYRAGRIWFFPQGEP